MDKNCYISQVSLFKKKSLEHLKISECDLRNASYIVCKYDYKTKNGDTHLIVPHAP